MNTMRNEQALAEVSSVTLMRRDGYLQAKGAEENQQANMEEIRDP